jgi:pimeloyl-ACP methyl ester carboxylesterase
MVSAVEAASQAAQWFGPFEAVVGHSFGGAVAVNATVGSIDGLQKLVTKRLVLVAAPSSLPLVFDGFSQMLNVGPRSRTVMAGRVKRIAGRPLSDFVGDRQLAATQVPTLVIHAPDDREVSAEQAKLYADAGPHVELYWADGLGHRRILSDPAVVERAVSFVEPVAKLALH